MSYSALLLSVLFNWISQVKSDKKKKENLIQNDHFAGKLHLLQYNIFVRVAFIFERKVKYIFLEKKTILRPASNKWQ